MFQTVIKNFSFDTLRFVIPISFNDRQDLLDIFQCSSEYRRYDINGQVLKSFVKFRMMTSEEILKQRSYSDDITFTEVEQGFIFELSAPKYLWGHSSLLCWDFLGFLERFRIDLCELSNGYPFPEINTWILKRIDICYNFVMNSYDDVKNTLSYLIGMRLRGKSTIRRDYPYWVSKNRTLKFYSKFDEMKQHKDNFYCNFDMVRSNSAKIIRFEVEWRAAHLLRRINIFNEEKIQSRSELTIDNFIQSMINYSYDEHIRSYLNAMDKKIIIDVVVCFDTIESSFRKSKSYHKFFQVCLMSIKKAKEIYSQPTFYRYKRKLKEIGIDIDVFEEMREASKDLNKPGMIHTESIVNETDEEAQHYNEMMQKYGWSEEELERKIFIGSPEWKAKRLRYANSIQQVKIEGV